MPNKDTSVSLRVANAFMESYKAKNPDHEVEVLDLYEKGMPHYSQHDFNYAIFTKEHLSDEDIAARDFSYALIDQFMAADKIVVSAPMWNFSFPSILSAYIDHIVVAGKTFEFSSEGPRGLVSGKKIAFICARGGVGYDDKMKEYEHLVTRLGHVFGFLGITDQSKVVVEGTAMEDREERITKALEDAKVLGASF